MNVRAPAPVPIVYWVSGLLAVLLSLAITGMVIAVSDLASYGARIDTLTVNVTKLQDLTQGLDGHFGPDGNMAKELDAIHDQEATTAVQLRSLNSYLNRGPKP